MSLVGFSGQNHPQQVDKRGADVSVDDRETPPEVFAPLHERYAFTLDVAATAHNAKVPRYFDVDADGLAQSWGGERVWCNPPYSGIEPWVRKAWTEEACPLVVMLLPANRTEQGWWQALVEPYRDRAGGLLRVEFLRGRPHFLAPGSSGVSMARPKKGAPFGLCLLVWDRRSRIAPPNPVPESLFATGEEVDRG